MEQEVTLNEKIANRKFELQTRQKTLIMEEDWDYLIILDACRYDYFSKLYKRYFSGDLKKVISSGSNTLEWAKKTFHDKLNDVVYISANPFINSYSEIDAFFGKDHFFKIINVWYWGWDDKLGTVHPIEINRTVKRYRDHYSNKRLIIHYLQPHAPYINYSLHIPGYPRHRLSGIQEKKKVSGLNKFLDNCLREMSGHEIRFFGRNLSWELRELLNLPPSNPTDAIRRKFGDHILRQAYEENLNYVMQYVKNLLKDLSGTVIITSDHGEWLGEGKRYSHYDKFSDPILVQVPWFKVKRIKKEKTCDIENIKTQLIDTSSQAYSMKKEEIKKRLSDLGYI
jgi:hypothetical protein